MTRFCPKCQVDKPLEEYYTTQYSRNKGKTYGYCKSCYLNYNKEIRYGRHYFRQYVKRIEKRSLEKSIPFNLDESFLEKIWTEKCPIFDHTLTKGTSSLSSASLDRLVPEKGYTKGNVFWISWEANTKKNGSSVEDLEKIIKYIKDRL